MTKDTNSSLSPFLSKSNPSFFPLIRFYLQFHYYPWTLSIYYSTPLHSYHSMPNSASSTSTYTTLMRVTTGGRPYCQVLEQICFISQRSFFANRPIAYTRISTICSLRLLFNMGLEITVIDSGLSATALCSVKRFRCLDTCSLRIYQRHPILQILLDW